MTTMSPLKYLAGLLIFANFSVGYVQADSTEKISDHDLNKHERGRAIYNFRCYFCHGYSGDAKTLASTYLKPQPRDFTSLLPGQLGRKEMLHVVMKGRNKTGMAGFANILTQQEIEWVVDFIRSEFIQAKRKNTQYHTKSNGWPNHERYVNAFPFATGLIKLDTPWEQLTVEQRRGKQRFLTSCISCHDRGKVKNEGLHWEAMAVSFPLKKNPLKIKTDTISGASVYQQHEQSPAIAELSKEGKKGKKLYLENCAFCHAKDGTGRNWIGAFLEPHPRDLTKSNLEIKQKDSLIYVIENGLAGTTMPAWKSVLSKAEIKSIAVYINEAFRKNSKLTINTTR